MSAAVPLQEALGRLGELIDAAHKETIIIVKGDRAVRLAPVSTPAKRTRHAGSAAGRIHMADDFDAPLDDFSEYA